MPLVAHNDLPTFRRLQARGQEVLSLSRARQQDIRELHIGFLNMMPDAALAATEQQFIRLVGSCNQIAQFYVYPFSLPELNRGSKAEEHIGEHYFDFEELKELGLDALIITGANVINPSLDEEKFWSPLIDVVRWADENVASILCSCLATHALLNHFHGITRQHMSSKQWGVYNHRIIESSHPLMRNVNTRFDAPHSRFNDISRQLMEEAGLTVLAENSEVGVLMAVSPDQFRAVYFQGHPEYDAVSLLKEYKREVNRYLNDELDSPPPCPENYFSVEAMAIIAKHIEACVQSKSDGGVMPVFPEDELMQQVDNTWGDTGKAIINNWLGLVYQLTNLDRRQQFMQGVDREDPLSYIRQDRQSNS
jgi:homoserine O-succinyltransferase